MAENDVTIQINVDAKDAQQAIDDFGRASTKALKNTEKQSNNFFNTFKAGALRLAGPISAVVGGFLSIQKGINEAVEDAKLTRQIEASLLAVGDASSDTVQGILDFADAIKDATGVSDDLVKSTFITAQNFGISTDKAKELTVAAIDLAAATGTDVESAVRLLGGTFDGTVGKLANYGEEFRNLTKEQLEAGDAIDIVSKKFGGSAAKDLDTFSGRLGQLSNSFGDFLKEIGKTVTESPAVQAALSATAEGIDEVTEAIKRSKQEEESRDFSFGASVLGASGAYIQAAENIRQTNEQLKAFRDIEIGGQSKAVADGFAGIVEKAQGASSVTADFVTRLQSFPVQKVTQDIGLTGKALEELKKKAKETREQFEKFQGGIVSGRGTEQEKVLQKQKDDLKQLEAFAKQSGAASAKEISALRIKINQDTANQLLKIEQDTAKKGKEEAQKAAEEAAAEWKAILEKRRQDFENSFANPVRTGLASLFSKDSISSESVAGAVSGGLSLALQGKEGAKQFTAQLFGGAADLFLPGIGGAVTQIAGLLAQGPDQVKKVIEEFVKYVPEFIEAIADSIPVVVETLIDVLLFKGGLERIIGALIRASARVSIALAVAFRDAVVNGANAIGNAIGRFFSDALDAIFEPIQDLFKPLEDALNFVGDLINQLFQPIVDLIDAISGAFGGKGGGRGLIAETFDRWFSRGGLVYAADGFFQPRGTDTVPAMLTPGELVVPRDMVGELGAFLMNQKSEAPGSDAAMLSAIYAAVSGPLVVKTEAKVNQQAFADIILQLNRQNARLRA